MKKIFLFMSLAALALTACDDDRDDNPTLVVPETFELLTPAYAATPVDLGASEEAELAFTWVKPVFAFPTYTTYAVQISPTATFNVSVAQAEADSSLTADYIALDVTTAAQSVTTYGNINKGLMGIYGWESEDEVPAELTLTARVVATIGAIAEADTKKLTSNSVTFRTAPKYVPLEEAAPLLWYLVGGCIGDGSWGNSESGIGTSLVPLLPIEGETYDKVTGVGPLQYTGWFPADGEWKVIGTPGNWDIQWGSSDGGITPVANDGGSGNFKVPADGFYTVALNNDQTELTITPADITAPAYATLAISGSFNEWGSDELTPVNTAMAQNHFWRFEIDATDGDKEVKFKLSDSWDVNWGSAAFPYGIGLNNGANIPVLGGSKYTVFFNDADGSYYFIKQK